MVLFIGKKRWLEMCEQVQSAQEASEICQTKIDAIHASLQTVQNEISEQVMEKLNPSVNNIDQALEMIQAAMHQQKEILKHKAEIDQKVQTDFLQSIGNIRNVVAQLLQKLNDVEASGGKYYTDIQESNVHIAEDIKNIGKDISAQLMLLDESSRLLLLHTVMNELDVK